MTEEVTEQVQDQQAEQAVEQATTMLVDHLRNAENNEIKTVVLLMRMSVKLGFYAGVGLDQATDQHFAAIDLPVTGQVAWFLESGELTLFEGASLYDKPLEPASYEQRYERIAYAGL